nr:CSC1-like protein ERD4 [Malus domestica]
MFFVGYDLELSRLVPLIIFHTKWKYFCKSEDEVKAAWLPRGLGYGTRVPGDMLMITIVLCYSVIAPLILPFGVLYFGLGWLVLRNQALKSLHSIVRKLWKDVAAHPSWTHCISDTVPSYHVWFIWGEEILLCTILTSTFYRVIAF